jgi:hypothetical protein
MNTKYQCKKTQKTIEEDDVKMDELQQDLKCVELTEISENI